jgi:hypothetical protein
MDLTGFAGTLKGSPNSSSALFQFTIKARLESGVPLEKMPVWRPAFLKYNFLYDEFNRLRRDSKRIAELQFGSFLVYH